MKLTMQYGQKVASVLDFAEDGLKWRDEGGGEKSFLLDPISYTHTHTLEERDSLGRDRAGLLCLC